MSIDESKLNKGHVRKLNALRKSVGDALAEKVFGRWLAGKRTRPLRRSKIRWR